VTTYSGRQGIAVSILAAYLILLGQPVPGVSVGQGLAQSPSDELDRKRSTGAPSGAESPQRLRSLRPPSPLASVTAGEGVRGSGASRRPLKARVTLSNEGARGSSAPPQISVFRRSPTDRNMPNNLALLGPTFELTVGETLLLDVQQRKADRPTVGEADSNVPAASDAPSGAAVAAESSESSFRVQVGEPKPLSPQHGKAESPAARVAGLNGPPMPHAASGATVIEAASGRTFRVRIGEPSPLAARGETAIRRHRRD